MAEPGADAGAPNLNLTVEEKRVYGQLFRQADLDGVGVVTGDVAVKFFDKTRLDSRVLGEIWQIADRENRGFLTPAGFGIVLRLIGHAQAGREPAAEVALQPGPLPRFDGITIQGVAAQPIGPPPAAGPIPAQGTGGVRIPPLTPEKAAQFAGLFEQQPLAPGNMLPGDQARQIFERSGLPTEVLGRIWQLADTEQRGALVQTEFIIAMHLLATTKQGQLRALPTVVPAGLYEAATRRPTGIPRQQSPSPVAPPIPAIPRQLSGQAQMRTGSPLGRSHPAPPGGDWLVTAADKVRFDQEYAKLDKANRGFITGEEAVPFFSQSRLPEDTLAQIWDLADLTSQGRLTRDEFAIAMYLIRQQRTNRDTPLPTTVPQNLIPPSMRAQVRPPTATGSSAFDVPQQPMPAPQPQPQPQPKSALDDLFGLDSPPTMPAAPVQKAVTTGGSNDPFGSNASPAPASPARPSPTTSSFAPFVPSSSFGRTLTAQATGASTSSAGGMQRSGTLPPQAAAQDDLLGDSDDVGKSLSNDTAELANLSNQITSLSKHVQEVRGQQATTQNELTQASAQKKNFEQRLSQLRAAYEKEAKDVRALEEQLNASRTDTKKLQTEMAMLEGTYQDLQAQHRQVATALQADQQENAALKERIRVVNAEVAQLKPKIEKLRSEARQQKGLVAINKKQLATNEGERDKLNNEAEELAKSNEDLARQASTGSPVPAPAQLASPTPSSASVNNPFFRRTGSTDIMGAFASPAAKPFDKSFDDVFGPSPSFPASTGTPPPATAFGPQHTGASTGSAASSFATPATSNTPNLSRTATLAPNPIPPPPSQTRQISSSFPFGEAPESMTSSHQISPPVSRMGQPDTPLAEAGAKSPAVSALEPMVTGQSITSESQRTLDNRPTSSGSSAPKQGEAAGAPAQGRAHSDSISDPFSAVDQAKAKDDFESAFASFKNAHGKSVGGPSSSGSAAPGNDASKGAFADAFNREFPPISELERDDYSDSDSEKDGFEDDFAPVSPPTNSAQPAKAPEATAVKPPAAEGATSEAAPSPTAATSSSSISTAMPAGQSNVNSIWGDSMAASSSPAPAAGQSEQESSAVALPPLPAKQAFDDLEDDFEGLEDAKEGSTADDDFANISRSALDDFNPVFDSSPPRSHAAKSDGGSNNAPAGGAPNFATESSSFDFVSGSSASLGSGSGIGAATSSGGASAPPAGPPPAAGGPENHDWDALFASLDEPQPASGAVPTAPGAPAVATNTTPGPSGSPPPPGAAASPSPAAPVPSRPAAAGRLLTEEGEHDDPILKNLTGMGYPRADALNALEKYDYNLERAANFLASQS
ncbi:hypothetical protein RB597_009878 [Gaeumannomyces tritici]